MFVSYTFQCYLIGPFGTPARDITRTEHAILVAAGIGVTPYASILQSVLARYHKQKDLVLGGCNECGFALKKLDFIWINRSAKAFEWFVQLLSKIELEESRERDFDKFLDIHLYITSAKTKTDMKGIGLQMALEMLHEKSRRDIITGLRTRLQAGRPNWKDLFKNFSDEGHQDVQVFYCGTPALGDILKDLCHKSGFKFSREIF